MGEAPKAPSVAKLAKILVRIYVPTLNQHWIVAGLRIWLVLTARGGLALPSKWTQHESQCTRDTGGGGQTLSAVRLSSLSTANPRLFHQGRSFACLCHGGGVVKIERKKVGFFRLLL